MNRSTSLDFRSKLHNTVLVTQFCNFHENSKFNFPLLTHSRQRRLSTWSLTQFFPTLPRPFPPFSSPTYHRFRCVFGSIYARIRNLRSLCIFQTSSWVLSHHRTVPLLTVKEPASQFDGGRRKISRVTTFITCDMLKWKHKQQQQQRKNRNTMIAWMHDGGWQCRRRLYLVALYGALRSEICDVSGNYKTSLEWNFSWLDGFIFTFSIQSMSISVENSFVGCSFAVFGDFLLLASPLTTQLSDAGGALKVLRCCNIPHRLAYVWMQPESATDLWATFSRGFVIWD